MTAARHFEILIELRARRAEDGGQGWGGFVVSYRVDRGRRQVFEAELQPGMTLLQLLEFSLRVIDAGERVTGNATRRTAAAVGAPA